MSDQSNLKHRNIKEISNDIPGCYDNIILHKVNDHCVRMTVMQGEYPWHYHEHTDEMFIVVEGALKIEIMGCETQVLMAGDFLNIPAKTVHKTSAELRTVNLCFEKNQIDTVFV